MRKTLLMIAVLVLALGLVYALGEDKVEQQVSPAVTNPALSQQEEATPAPQASDQLQTKKEAPVSVDNSAEIARIKAEKARMETAADQEQQAELAAKEAKLASQPGRWWTSTSNVNPNPGGESIQERIAAIKADGIISDDEKAEYESLMPKFKPEQGLILQGGDNCADYFDLGSTVPATDAGSTVGYANDYGPFATQPACWTGYFGANYSCAGPDVTYKFTAPADSVYNFSLCGSSYDTGLLLYNFTCPTEPVYPDDFICGNDDSCGLQSELDNIPLTAGQEVLVVVDGYSTGAGDYVLNITYYAEVVFACPEGSTDEGEGCGNDTNGGCNMTVPAFGSIDCGETICGSAWMDGGTRDTDWYMLNITDPQYITITASAEFPFIFGVVEQVGPGECDNSGYISPYATGNAEDIVTLNATVPVCGPVILFFAPSSFYNYPCANGDTTYWMEVTCEPIEMPLAACCYGYPDPPTCENLTEAECCALEGLWYEGEDCANVTCPITPANDLCTNAEAIAGPFPVTVTGTTLLATGDSIGTCTVTGNENPGVWYTVTGTGNTMTASLCNSTTTWDSKIQVWCYSCDYPMCVGGDDDGCDAPVGLKSIYSWCTEEGTEYLILVYQYGSSGGSFDLTVSDDGTPCSNPPICEPQPGACCYGDPLAPDCIDGVTEQYCLDTQGGFSWVEGALCSDDPSPCPPLAQGDDCSYPYEITELPYNDAGYTCDFSNSCPGAYSSPDVIYELDLSGETDPIHLVVSLCGSAFDTYLDIYQNDCCTGTAWMVNDDFCGTQSQIEADFPPAVYYIVVEGYSSNCGDYVLFVGEPPTGRCCDYSVDPYNPTCTDGVIEADCQGTGQVWTEGLLCDTDPCPLPPANDECSTAEVITGPYPYSGSGSNILGQNVDCPGVLDWNAVWYDIDLPYDLNYVTITICPPDDDVWTTGIILMNDCACDDYLLATTYAFPICDNGHTGVQLYFEAVPGGARTSWFWPAYFINTSGEGMDFDFTIEVTPPPTGRCCDYSVDPENPVCTDDVVEADCALEGMTWAEGLDCTTYPCPTTPANDACEDAIAITGPYPATGTGSTFMATIDCPDLLGWNASWYSIDLPYEYNHVTITACGLTADFGTAGLVLMDDCVCDDFILADVYRWLTADQCGTGHTGFEFEMFTLPAGTYYWPAYYIDANGAGLEFDYTVNVQELILPPNDLCDNAIAVDIPSSTIGYTMGATLDIVPGAYCGTAVTAPGVWYSLTGNGNTVTVSTCNAYTTYDTKISVFCAGCSGLACVGGNDDNCPEYTYRSSYSFCTEAETEYLVLVHGYSAAVGDFELDVIDGNACSSPPDCTPPIGSCCYGDFYNQQCTEGVTIGECIDMDGISWTQDGTCELNPCPNYAHCGLDPTSMTGSVEEAGPGNTDTGVISVSNIGSASLTFTTSVSIDPPPVSAALRRAEPGEANALIASVPKGSEQENQGIPFEPGAALDFTGSETFDTNLGEFTNYSMESTTIYWVWSATYGNPPGCAVHGWSTEDTENDYLISNGAYTIPDLDNQVLFWDQYDIFTPGSYYDTHEVLISTNFAGDPGAATWTQLYEGDAATAWETKMVSLDAFRGQTVNIAFHYVGYDGDYWYVDNVSVETFVLPSGRCCDYTDRFNPVCTDDVLEADCQGAVQAWTEALNCTDDPCIPNPGCPEGAPYGQVPNMPYQIDVGANFYTSDATAGYTCYDNFGGAFGTIEGIKFWGMGFDGANQCYPSEFEVVFYEDNAGVPGTPVATYDVSIVGTGTGIIFEYAGLPPVEMYEYETTFDTPLSLNEGWVSVVNTVAGCTYYWAGSIDPSSGDDMFMQNTLVITGFDLAFCLTGTYVAPWLTVDVAGGTINPGDPAMDVTVTMDAAELECHDNPYTGRINFYTNDPQNLSMTVPVAFTVCAAPGFQYVPGDANMMAGLWKPQVIGGDVTYMVGYFRGINPPCLLGDPGFYCSADANGDCNIIGSDVTKMVAYFRGLTSLSFCADYPPLWMTPADCPDTAPPGWPPCAPPPAPAGKTLPSTPSK